MNSAPVDLARRRFLVLSSLSTFAAAALGPSIFTAGQAQAQQLPRLAIGHVPLEGNGRIYAASRNVARDGAFISRGARVSIVGVRGVGDRPSTRRVVEVRANFSYFDGGTARVAPYFAWAANRTNGAEGGRVGFNVPVDVEQKLDLAFTLESDVATATLPVVLSLKNDRGSLGLARGTFVFVPLFDRESAPNWPDYAMRDGAVVDGRGAPAGFEHFVIDVGYGTDD